MFKLLQAMMRALHAKCVQRRQTQRSSSTAFGKTKRMRQAPVLISATRIARKRRRLFPSASPRKRSSLIPTFGLRSRRSSSKLLSKSLTQSSSRLARSRSRQLLPMGETLELPIVSGLTRLEEQVDRINHLSAQLEIAMFDLKAIADTVHRDWRLAELHHERPLQEKTDRPAILCEYSTAVVPYVCQRDDRSFLLTVRAIDLFKAERDAMRTATALRQWSQRKKVTIPNRKTSQSIV